jgi:hypothetical protein
MMLCLVFRVRTSTSLSSSTRPEILPPPGYGFGLGDLGCQATGHRPTWRDDYLQTSQLADLSLALNDDLEPKAQSTYLLIEHA